MATSSQIPTHGGLERVIDRVAATQSLAQRVFSRQNLPTVVLGLTIMAVVTLTERAMDAVDAGFALEWAILTLVALTTFALFARMVRSATRAVIAWCADFSAHAAQTRSDIKGLHAARLTSDVASEIVVAQSRADALLKNYRLRAGAL